MELIKQIKEAEARAKEIVEKARIEAAKLLEQAKAQRAEELKGAEEERKKMVAEAVAMAENDGQIEVENLTKLARQKKDQIISRAGERVEAAVRKVVNRVIETGR